jgi:DNA-binding NtrC family response regulator
VEKTILVISDETNSCWLRALRQALRLWAELYVLSEQEARTQDGDVGYALLIIDAAGISSDAGTVIEYLRAAFPRTPIVVATLSPSWERARQAFLAGAGDYIAKSLDREAIRNSFRDYLIA